MAVGQPALTKPDLKEVIASVTAWVAALALTLSNEVLRADQAMALAMVMPSLGWTAMKTYAFRHWFVPKPPQAEESDGENSVDEASTRWGIHRRWMLGIVTPVVVVVLLSIGYDAGELVGPDGRLPAPVLLVLLFAVAPWILGLVAFLMVVVPGGLIYSGLRPDMGARGSRVFGGIWAYVFVAFGITAAQGAEVPTFGSLGWMGEGLAILFGFDEEAVTSPGWMWAARVLLAVGFLVMPVLGILLKQRSKRAQGPQDEKAA